MDNGQLTTESGEKTLHTRLLCHYSVIQYEPCPARRERMNVGVCLLCESERFLKSATLAGTQFRDIADQFPRDKTPCEAIEEFTNSVAIRLAAIESDLVSGERTGSALWSYAHYMSNQMRMSEPRSIAVTGDLNEALARLFKDLVEVGS